MCKLELGKHPIVGMVDGQIDQNFIQENIKIREYNQKNNTTEVLFYLFEDNVLYKMWDDYYVPINHVEDEVGVSQPIAQNIWFCCFEY